MFANTGMLLGNNWLLHIELTRFSLSQQILEPTGMLLRTFTDLLRPLSVSFTSALSIPDVSSLTLHLLHSRLQEPSHCRRTNVDPWSLVDHQVFLPVIAKHSGLEARARGVERDERAHSEPKNRIRKKEM